jgi:hypothetical protein
LRWRPRSALSFGRSRTTQRFSCRSRLASVPRLIGHFFQPLRPWTEANCRTTPSDPEYDFRSTLRHAPFGPPEAVAITTEQQIRLVDRQHAAVRSREQESAEVAKDRQRSQSLRVLTTHTPPVLCGIRDGVFEQTLDGSLSLFGRHTRRSNDHGPAAVAAKRRLESGEARPRVIPHMSLRAGMLPRQGVVTRLPAPTPANSQRVWVDPGPSVSAHRAFARHM